MIGKITPGRNADKHKDMKTFRNCNYMSKSLMFFYLNLFKKKLFKQKSDLGFVIYVCV
jgi:hypothetical protein